MAINTASNIMLTDSKTGEAAILKALPIELGDDGSIIIKVNGITTLSDATDRLDLDETKNVAATPKAVASILSEQLSNYIEDVIKEGGGLKVDSDGKIYVDFSGMSSSDLTSLIKQIISETGGLTVDENGQIVVDFSQMSKEELSELVEQIIASNGGLVTDSNGKIVIDFSKLSESQVTDLSETIVQEGGGLAVDENGQIYVDFSTMPTDKFEAMLQSIRVPIWLEKSTNFYVDGTNGSDDNDGSTSSSAFKTIQACVNHVCNNYNIVSYSCYIRIAEGTYEESIELPDYSRTSGQIYLCTSTASVTPIIKYTNNSVFKALTGGDFILRNLKIYCTCDQAELTNSTTSVECIRVANYSVVQLQRCQFKLTAVGDEDSTYAPSSLTALRVSDNAQIILLCSSSTDYQESRIDIEGDDSLLPSAGIWVYRSGRVSLGRTNASDDVCINTYVSGKATCFINIADNSSVSIYGNGDVMQFIDDGFEGRRYILSRGSSIYTKGQGEEYFPGTESGTIDSSTYCWYQ